jgi:hypothetical protein
MPVASYREGVEKRREERLANIAAKDTEKEAKKQARMAKLALLLANPPKKRA